MRANIFVAALLVLLFAREIHAFETTDEYYSHTAGLNGCVSSVCHAEFIPGKKSFQHEPGLNPECDECHTAAYPNKYGLKDEQGLICLNCHKKMEVEIQSNTYVHGPVKNGDCSSCHDPHGSDTRFMLRASYSKLCSVCHSLKGLYAGTSVHKPVRDGNCGICHDPHASNHKSRLTDTGANICFICHEEMVTGMTGKYIHEPILISGCTDCHDPHSGENDLRLRATAEEICITCHDEKKNEISQYTSKHDPAEKGQCISCHSPHFSENEYLLLDKIDSLCFKCHKENSIWKKRRFQHGPVVQGNCSACHNPHGSDNAYILRMSFPHKFYSAYEKGEYDLCFNCHKESIITAKETVTITNFRNGRINLHTLHVNQKKGRTCRACHDVHASDQYYHIREEFLFGAVNIPIEYSKTDTGGRCLPGCHKERRYDRVEMVDNKK